MTILTEDLRQKITRSLADEPDCVLEERASAFAVPLSAVMDCLPQAWVTRVGGEHFIAVLSDIAEWGDVTFVCHTADAIIEVSGPVPEGRMGHGMYNLQGAHGGLGGHLRPERCAAIYFVRRPFMGVETMSVQFVNPEGGVMFKIFVGRDAQRALKTDQIARFDALIGRLAA